MTDLTELTELATAVIAACQARGLRIATAESCTGGLIIAALTEVPGSSAVVDRGFVTYSNEAKVAMLGVPAALIAAHGAVSAPVAIAMVEGVLAHAPADLAIATTGIAGPAGGTPAKPVGLVHLAAQRRGQPPRHIERRFDQNGRPAIRLAATREALELVRSLL